MIRQEELPIVAIPSMNDTHLEDIILINKLSSAAQSKDADSASTIFAELIEHTITHFSGEEEMMREKNFPPYSIHKAEHDRVLKELKAVGQRFNEEKDFELIKAYVDGALAPWLIQHVETLDTVTAMFLKNGTMPS